MGCAVSKRKIKPDSNANTISNGSKPTKGEHVKVVTPLRGDVTRRLDARLEREKRIREKQGKILGAAEAMSVKVMDEHERLSLSTRATSRATSRGTSRTASPTSTAKKHVKFADCDAVLPRGESFSKQWVSDGRRRFKDMGDNRGAGEQNTVTSPEEDLSSVASKKALTKTPSVVISGCSPRRTDAEVLSYAHKIDANPIPIAVT